VFCRLEWSERPLWLALKDKQAGITMDSSNVDWLSGIQQRQPVVPESICRIISESDKAFCRRDDTVSAAEDLRKLEVDVVGNLHESLRVSSRAHAAVLQRRLIFALDNDEPVNLCFGLFEALSRVGFESPVEKSRIVILLLQYLEIKLAPVQLKPLAKAMVEELETCRIGCEENLSILDKFLKAQPDDPTQTTS
jgi:hypothetical protein